MSVKDDLSQMQDRPVTQALAKLYRNPNDVRRIAELEAALREIAGTYDETPQTPTKLCAALYAVSKLAEHALRNPTV